MLLGTLKETLVFQHDADDAYRYEIYKNERHGGYFVIIHVLKEITRNSQNFSAWEIASPFLTLKSNYLPNARVECELHFKEQSKMTVA